MITADTVALFLLATTVAATITLLTMPPNP